MQMQTLEQVRRNVREQATRAFSFDVFDTFLLRRCTTPEGVFERACQHAPISLSRRGLVESYVQHRIQAEARAHYQAVQERGSPEVTIDEIYRRFPFRLFGLDRSALPALVRAEFQAEIDLGFASPEMAQLCDDLRASGIRVGFISDTYWNQHQLAELLRSCRPELQWDFLYASCQHCTGKGEALFRRYLADQRLAADAAVHIGDNEAADVAGAQRHGIRAIHYPQATKALAPLLARESAIAALVGFDSGRLDRGLRSLRRVVAARAPSRSAAFSLGVNVLGPVMAAFDRFAADRVARIVRPGRKIAIAFLARDAHLPMRMWQTRSPTGAYVEVNRRIAMVASATDIKPLVDFFDKVPEIDAKTFGDILKSLPPRVAAFFQHSVGGVTTGKAFAQALPKLIDTADLIRLSADMRRKLMAHLRRVIPDLDILTDLVLVDLGYSGTMQKAFRRIFAREGLAARLHGLYLLTTDDDLADLAEGDTAEGFISDLVVTPHVKHTMLRNVTVLEHLCSASAGSVQHYRHGEVVREPDPRPPAQHTLCGDAQAGALHFAGSLAELPSELDPFADLDAAAQAAAGVLARLLLLPTDDELVLFSDILHDVNMGTQTVVSMIDPLAAGDLETSQSLPTAFIGGWPPMWLAGSMAALSPAHGFLYALFGAGRLSSDVFGDAKCGTAKTTLVGKAQLQTVEASCFRTGFGEVRIKIPILRKFGTDAVAVQVAAVARHGLLRGATLQTGDTIAEAMTSRKITRLPSQSLQGADIDFDGEHYRAVTDAGQLVILLPPLAQPAAVLTVHVKPLGAARVLALADAG
jgi:FMN phosphatase YigB (HAD superfamily)